MSDSTGNALSFGYDALGRQTSAGNSWLGTKSSAYDLAGRRTRLTHRDGFFVDYDYLVTGEVARIRENGATSGVGVLATFGYDDLGRRTSLTYGNGTATTYAYDAGRLSQLALAFPDASKNLTLGFSYNPADEIVSNTRSNDLYALLPAGAGTTASSANGLNQLTQQGATSFSYDAKGNLTADGSRTFAYTAENRMAQRVGVANLGHDPLGRLYGISSTGTVFDYDGPDAVLETDIGTGTSTRARYIHGPADDEPLVAYDGSGTGNRSFLHADERGSIVAVSDSAGNVTAINKYDEYGEPGAGNVGRFQYTGQKWISELGLYDYKARMYDPKIGGRFLQPDPIGYDDGMNMYNAMGGNPVNGWDPTGLTTSAECQQDRANAIEEGNRAIGYVCGSRTSFEESNRRFTNEQIGRELASFALGSAPVVGNVLGLYTLATGENLITGQRVSGLERATAAFGFLGKVSKLGRLRGIAKRFGGCGCLEAGTLVATSEGLVPIESIEVGDLVLAQNEATGEIAAKPVTDLIRPEPKPLYQLTLKDASGETETFHATDDHPWKVEAKAGSRR